MPAVGGHFLCERELRRAVGPLRFIGDAQGFNHFVRGCRCDKHFSHSFLNFFDCVR